MQLARRVGASLYLVHQRTETAPRENPAPRQTGRKRERSPPPSASRRRSKAAKCADSVSSWCSTKAEALSSYSPWAKRKGRRRLEIRSP